VAVLEEIGRIFGLHHLALEDALNLWQHPKIEEYGGNVFVVMRTVEDVGELATEQFAVGFGKGFVVTFQEREGDPLESVRRRLRQGVGRIRGWGADYLAYAIIDAVVDDYYLHLERLGDRLEALEPRAMGRPDRLLMRDIQRLHHDVQAMARIARPLQEALVELSRDPTPLIEPRVRPFLRDCCDHVKQILGMIDGYREAEVSLKSLTLSALTHRMNEVIRLLAVISTIFAPLTFIVGIYGMNFDPSSSPWNMPELRWYWGYPFSFGLMGLAAAGVLTYFARKGWLAPEELSEPPPAAPPKQRN
jgi:magnesium transporter